MTDPIYPACKQILKHTKEESNALNTKHMELRLEKIY